MTFLDYPVLIFTEISFKYPFENREDVRRKFDFELVTYWFKIRIRNSVSERFSFHQKLNLFPVSDSVPPEPKVWGYSKTLSK